MKCIGTKQIVWFVGAVLGSTGFDRAADAMIFTLENQSDVVIQRVQAGPDYEGWRDDLLGSTVLPPGNQRQFDAGGAANHCMFDIRVEWASGLYREFMDRDLCEDPHVVFDGGFFEGNELTIANEGEETIYYIRVSVDHDLGWSDDLLAVEGILSQGEEFTTQLHQFTEDQCLFDVLVQDEDDRQHVYEDVDICKTARLVHPGANGGTPTVPVVREGLVMLDAVDPGHSFQDCDICPFMVVVEGGTYQRGSRKRDDEAPVRKVTVPGPFAVGEFEVTVAQYQNFVRETSRAERNGCFAVAPGKLLSIGRLKWEWFDEKNWRSAGFEQNDSHPVVCVSWEDATAYAAWLAEKTGLPYRLLTEAEWEFLGQEAVTDFEQSDKARCRDCGGKGSGRRGSRGTVPVGRFDADGRGVSDLFGNAAEWVQDCYQSSYASTPRDGSAWLPQTCEWRVVRGGSWYNRASTLRASRRDHAQATRRNSSVGFRVARGPHE